MKESMNILIQMAKLNGSESIIDIGAGSGEISKLILDSIPNGDLTLLDSSPKMIEKAQILLKNYSNVQYIIKNLNFTSKNTVKTINKKYNYIFCHMSLAAIVVHSSNLDDYIQWCSQHLGRDGKILINAHNGILTGKKEINGYKKWKDVYRTSLNEVLKKYNLELYQENNQQYTFKEDEILGAFQRNGFSLDDFREDKIEISMQDRALMWKTPAIFNTQAKISEIGIRKVKLIIDEVLQKTLGKETMPRIVKSWLFKKE